MYFSWFWRLEVQDQGARKIIHSKSSCLGKEGGRKMARVGKGYRLRVEEEMEGERKEGGKRRLCGISFIRALVSP